MSKETLKETAPSRNTNFTNDIMSRLHAIEHLHESFTQSLATTFSEALGKPVTTQIAFRDLTVSSTPHKKTPCPHRIGRSPTTSNHPRFSTPFRSPLHHS